MKRFLLYIIPAILLFCSCSTDDIQTFGEEHEIYFAKYFKDEAYPGTAKADSTLVTFFFADDDDECVYGDLIVYLSGRQLERDLHFSLRVVEDMTTAQPEEYTLADSYTFRALQLAEGATVFQDTIHIQLNRSSRLASLQDGYRLTLEIVPNDEVGVGPYERSRAVLRIMQDPVQPEWWTREVSSTLMGDYSPKKYKTFLQNVEGAERLDGVLISQHPDQALKLVRQFKQWLLENPTYEEDGDTLMTVNV